MNLKSTASLLLLSLLVPLTGMAAQGDFFPNNQSSLRVNGITGTNTSNSHPNGTGGSVQFNLFRDSRTLSSARGYGGSIGAYSDERDFISVKRLSGGNHTHGLSNLQTGEKIAAYVYAHNNATQVCGGGNFARNTQVKFDWSNPSRIVGSVSASNATPRQINDVANLSYAGDFMLKPVGNSKRFFFSNPDYKPACGGNNNPGFTSSNISPSLSGDTASFNLGSVAGSYGNLKIVMMQFEVVPKPQPPSISIDKDDSTPGTNDTDGNDSQRIDFDGDATFTITVTNNGPVALRNVVITDPKTQACARSAGFTAGQYAGGATPNFDPGESFRYVCNATNVTESFINTAQVNGNSVVDNASVSDSDPTTVVVDPAVPNIDIDKDDSTPGDPDTDGDDSQTIQTNGTATFTITVTNNGHVDLRNVRISDVDAPNCVRSGNQTQPLIAAIGNRDNIFDIDESFSYTCTDENVEDAYTNIAQVIGTPVDGQDDVIDSDTTEILLAAVPKIEIDKDDSTPGAIDIDGHDFQLVFSGNTATFTITVTNSSLVALRDVVINDPLAPNCSQSASQTLQLYPGNTFDPRESFQYQCTVDNVTEGFTNVADVAGISVEDGTQVVDEDDTVVEVPPISPVIDIDKDDSTPGLPDTDGDDTQTVNVGGVATFTITVTNVGNENLRNVVVTDPNNPACDLSAAQTASLLAGIGNRDNILNAGPNNVGESFTYTCTDDSVEGPYVNTANVVGIGVTRGDVVTDNDPTIVTTPGGEDPSINIDKNDSDDKDDTQTVVTGDAANFTIVVTNDGNVGLERVSVGDPLATNCSLTVLEALDYIRNTGDNDDVFDPNETFTYTCVDSNVTASYTNTANVIGFSIFSGTKVDDSDPTEVVVQPRVPTCTNSQFNRNTVPSNGVVTYSWNVNTQVPANAQLVCEGAGVSFSEDIGTRTSRDINIPGTATDGQVLTCKIVMPDATELCSDTVTIDNSSPEPAEITIIKDDQDNSDDTQQIESGGNAQFTITVTNTGTVDLRNVSVSDNNAPNCVRDEAATLLLVQATGNNDDTFNVGETFTYTCEEDGWTQSINEAITRGTPTNGDPVVTARDTTQITYPGTPPGGGGKSIPSVGTCRVNDFTDAVQCIAAKPVQHGPGWTEFDLCRNGNVDYRPRNNSGKGLRYDCAMDWAEDQELQLCGTRVGNALDVFETAQADASQCAPIVDPPLPPSTCTPVATYQPCPACIKLNATINKYVARNKAEIDNHASEVSAANGSKVTYKVVLETNITSRDQFEILPGTAVIKVYDKTIPTTSGNIWNRDGLIDGDEQRTWAWNSDEEYFIRVLDNSEITRLTNGTFELHYDMDTNLAFTKDTAQLHNVAFATIEYQYRTYVEQGDGTYDWRMQNGGQKVYMGIGDNACNPTPQDIIALDQGSTLGSIATVRLIRPFVEARGGNIAVRSNDRVTGHQVEGADATQGALIRDNSTTMNYDDSFDVAGNELETLKNNFQSDREAYFQNLFKNMSAEQASLPRGVNANGADVNTHTYESGIYRVQNGDLTIDSSSDLNFSEKGTTFVIEGGNLNIDSDVTLRADQFVAFVLRPDTNGSVGNIYINGDVETMDGVYIVETNDQNNEGQIRSAGATPDEMVSGNQLTVNGNLIGDLAHLLNYRRYIGQNSTTPKPSLVVAFDLRILESTPPILEQFLGQNWKEEVSQ